MYIIIEIAVFHLCVRSPYPGEHMYLLQHVFQNWFRDLSLDKLSAAAVLVFFIIFVLILLLKNRLQKEDNI